MNRKELTIGTLTLFVMSIIVHPIMGMVIGYDALIGLAGIITGIIGLWAVLFFNIKPIPEFTVKELDTDKVYIFQTNTVLSPEEFERFSREIKKQYPNKSNIISNGGAVEVKLK